jgi:hypothetical protein
VAGDDRTNVDCRIDRPGACNAVPSLVPAAGARTVDDADRRRAHDDAADALATPRCCGWNLTRSRPPPASSTPPRGRERRRRQQLLALFGLIAAGGRHAPGRRTGGYTSGSIDWWQCFISAGGLSGVLAYRQLIGQ